jgi:hypothetical protein
MFQENDQHRQTFMFSSINSLPKKLLGRLEASWAGTFYREIFVRIDEKVFAILFSVGLIILKSGFGWSDEEMYDHFCYDIQVRYALGYRDLGVGHFELRTLYNFRRRVTQYMQETGENLIEQVFEHCQQHPEDEPSATAGRGAPACASDAGRDRPTTVGRSF